MQGYLDILNEVMTRKEWDAEDKFWFSPGEREILQSVWKFLSDNQTSPHHFEGPRNIWMKREDGTPLNFKAKACYDLYTEELIGITFFFDRQLTSEEDIFSTFVYYAKLGDLTNRSG
jgi:hypothetical protein